MSVTLSDVASARIPGASLLPPTQRVRAAGLCNEFTAAAVRELRGILGSDDPADARALATFAAQGNSHALSIRHALRQLARNGSPLSRGWPPACYEAGDGWGGISDSLFALSQHRLLVAHAMARPDGRLGGGEKVRAAIQASWNSWESVPEGFEMVTGKIKGGDRHGLVVSGRRLDLLPAARALGAGLATQLFGAATSTTVTCLAGQGQLLGLINAGSLIQIPGSLGGIWWPGLNQVTRAWARNLPAPAVPPPTATDVADWGHKAPQVTEVTRRWCERVLDAGPAVLSSPLLPKDVAWLKTAGAPFAAELLNSLMNASSQGQRRFDGIWQQDPDVLAWAWLRLSQY